MRQPKHVRGKKTDNDLRLGSRADHISFIPICLFKGCNKRLKDHEYLHGDYCFHHSQILNTAMYKAKLWRYDFTDRMWRLERIILLDVTAYLYAKGKKDTPDVRTNDPYYRYDMLVNDVLDFCIYFFNPNLFD